MSGWGGFAHIGPLKPVEIRQERWAERPLLRWARVGDDGTVEWDVPTRRPGNARNVDAELGRITFRRDEGRGLVAHVPPRLNFDWFVEVDADEGAPAPIVGRARDITRWYVREDEFTGWHGLVCVDTVDEVRRYFEWLVGVWVQVPLARWLSIREAGGLDEISEKEVGYSYPAAYGAPRHVRSLEDREIVLAAAAEQASRAEAIASIALRGHVDANGERAVNHAARVAAGFDPVAAPVERAAAWLHDVLELTDVTASDLLAAGIHPAIVETVALLTRDHDVPEDECYERIRTNPTAFAVKVAALDDNAAGWRIRLLDEPTRSRFLQKCDEARAALGLVSHS